MPPELDIVIPVYNEGGNIVATLAGLAGAVTTPARVLICYDHADDDTLPAIKGNPQAHAGLPITFVRNAGRGAHSAVMAGFAASTAPFVLMYPADDHTNAPMLDPMMALAHGGCDIVCASRFMPGGAMVGCPPLKAALVRTANFTLRHLARLPATDASNGFRMFSRRVIEQHRGRVRPGLLLQHRAAGEGAPAGLEDRRGAGALVRAPARRQPLSGSQMASGLSALVWLRFRHDLSASPARDGRPEGPRPMRT